MHGANAMNRCTLFSLHFIGFLLLLTDNNEASSYWISFLAFKIISFLRNYILPSRICFLEGYIFHSLVALSIIVQRNTSFWHQRVHILRYIYYIFYHHTIHRLILIFLVHVCVWIHVYSSSIPQSIQTYATTLIHPARIPYLSCIHFFRIHCNTAHENFQKLQ